MSSFHQKEAFFHTFCSNLSNHHGAIVSPAHQYGLYQTRPTDILHRVIFTRIALFPVNRTSKCQPIYLDIIKSAVLLVSCRVASHYKAMGTLLKNQCIFCDFVGALHIWLLICRHIQIQSHQEYWSLFCETYLTWYQFLSNEDIVPKKPIQKWFFLTNLI